MKKINKICSYCDYEVKIEIKGTAYCGCDFEGDGKYENYSDTETKTINGGELLEQFAKQLNECDLMQFRHTGNKFYFQFFDPNNGSGSDITYTILKEILTWKSN